MRTDAFGAGYSTVGGNGSSSGSSEEARLAQLARDDARLRADDAALAARMRSLGGLSSDARDGSSAYAPELATYPSSNAYPSGGASAASARAVAAFAATSGLRRHEVGQRVGGQALQPLPAPGGLSCGSAAHGEAFT
jgi:hypothetical protein